VAERVAGEEGWSPPDVTRLALAVSEAVANAVEHGPGGAIRFRVGSIAGGIRVVVQDDGPGPAPQDLADASLPTDDLSEGGRGLYILRVVSDEVRVDAEGVHLLLRPRAEE
jgi:anti-sigma regulatory factor (Ser/Thr protein kinase)